MGAGNWTELETKALLDQVLEHGLVNSYFQPIVSLQNGDIIGYEVLSRGPEGTSLFSPLALIEAAHHYGRIFDLEMLFRHKALQCAKDLGKNQKMFVNIDPDVIKDPAFKSGLTEEALNQLGVKKDTIVFELTERTAIIDYQSFVEALNHYRGQGYQIAIDDAGSGYSGLKTIYEIRPNYIKVDMDLIRDIHKDHFKQSLMRSLVETAKISNIQIVAEGIENQEELKTLVFLGVHAGQGYYIGKPDANFQRIQEPVIRKIQDYAKILKNMTGYNDEYHMIKALIIEHEPIPSYESMTNALTVKRFIDDNRLRSVCICEQNVPVGLVTAPDLNAKLSGQYGFSLYAKKPISRLMKSDALIVDAFTPINTVAKLAMERVDDALYDDIIVTTGQQYLGIVPMKAILDYALSYERKSARELNPLSGLPGNPVISRVLNDAVQSSRQTSVCYIDINNFKVYNDIYGFEKGDAMILELSRILVETIKNQRPLTSFIGHIGGDDFIGLTEGDAFELEAIANAVIEGFKAAQEQFFSEEHIVQNKIYAEDRFGVVREFELTSLSIAGISGDLRVFSEGATLSAKLADLKKEAKKLPGYGVIIRLTDYV